MGGQVGVVQVKQLPSQGEVRNKILEFESELAKVPGAMFGDCFPLKHTFADGCYIREISVPKGHIIVTKIHKVAHPCFILAGDCSVLTEKGIQRIKAPFHMITPAGTKRIVYVHENTVWVTVHVTRKKNLKKIEQEIIATSFDELLDKSEEVKLINFINKVKEEEV